MSSPQQLDPSLTVAAFVHADHYYAPARIWGAPSGPVVISEHGPGDFKICVRVTN